MKYIKSVLTFILFISFTLTQTQLSADLDGQTANPGQSAFQPQTKEELQTAVDLWVSDKTSAVSKYDQINTWDVSLITDMSDLFKDKSTFNDDISNWDVSNVTTMYQMFRFAGSFNQDLSSWDVSNVTNMRQIFRAAVKFTSDLSNWNVSNVTDMASTFQESRSFTSDLSSWDVSKVKKMHYMFADARIFNGDISKWDVSSVTDMKYMFSITDSFNQDISGWNVSSVTDMYRMFKRAGSFNQDISGWNVSNVTDMNEMFGSATDASAMSNKNKCAIHTKFSSNANWSYDWSSSCTAGQIAKTYVPDNNFEQYLIDLGFDDILDDSVNTDNIKNKTYLNVSSKSISDLTGINGFTSLTTLHCYDNNLTSLDLSKNLLLRELKSNRNKITAIDVTVNDSLVIFEVGRNELTSVTGINNKPILEKLSIHNRQHDPEPRNKVDSLDASGSPLLDVIFAEYNNLSFINVAGSKLIESLVLDGNQLTNIDLSTVDSLKHLHATKNLLTELDLSNNTNLRLLDLSNNKLTSLDLSKNTLLTKLHSSDNNLTSLDLSKNLLLRELWSIRNAITSIDMSANDSLVFFSVNSNSLTSVTGVNNKPIMEKFYIHNVPHYGEVANNKVESLDVSGSPLLEILSTNLNNLSSINLTGCTSIITLDVDNNQLTTIDLSTVDSLKQIHARNNPLTKLDLSKNTNLSLLYLENNDKLDSLDVSNNKKLNNLTVLHSDELKYLNMKNGMMEMGKFDARFTPKLNCIETLDPNAAKAKWSYENKNIDLGDTFAINCGSIDYPDNEDYTLSFDGTDDYVVMLNNNNSLTIPGGITVESWVNLSVLQESPIVYKNEKGDRTENSDNYMLSVGTDGKFKFANERESDDKDFSVESTTLAKTGIWYHVAGVYDEKDLHIYVNGILENSVNVGDNELYTGPGPLQIGTDVLSNHGGADRYFNGKIDEVRVWNFARTQEKIKSTLSGLTGNEDGLQGYWKFNAGTDIIVYDYSGNLNHGAIIGATWSKKDLVVGCTDSLAGNYNSDATVDNGSCSGYPANGNFNISFDGVDDYISLPDLSYMNDLSFSAWYKIDTRDTWERIFDFGKGGSGDIFLTTKGGRTGGDLELTIHSSGKTHTIDPGITTDDGNWHHVVFTYDKGGSGMTLYIDGQNKGSNAYNTNSLSDFGSGQKFYLAKSNWNDKYYDGQMGEVGLYNKALSADEVTSIYAGGSNFNLNTNFGKYVSESNLIGYWKFDAGTDTIAYDHSGYANHAAINGATWINFDDSTSTPGLDKYKSPISLNPYPTSIESGDYTIDANGILDKPIDWSFPAISDTGDIIEFIVGSDWHSKRPKDLQILYGKKVVATWTHPSKEIGGCAKDLDDYLQNGLTISASDCDTSTPSFSTGVFKMKLDISEADSLKLRILSAWEENGILFNGAWIRTGNYSNTESSAIWVSALGSDLTGDGTSGNPFYTIQKGINHSKDGDSVLVHAGTYVENIDFTGKNITVIGENKFRTIIDGDSSGTVVTIDSGEDSTTLLKAFMIRNGIAKNGGGIKITNKSNPVIDHVIVHDNRSHTNGGGIYINNARASISHTIIRGNNSDGVAGGLYIGEGAEVTISYAQIINNIAAVRGGGIFIRKHTTSFNLKYALISHNSSYEGGGIGSWYGSSNLSNITFVGNNSTTNRGHAIFLREAAQMVLENSIVMGTESNVIYLEDSESSFSATYSMIEKGWEGEGNIIADPLFCNLEIGNNISQIRNYSLWENSPCLGSGKDGADMGAFGMRCDAPKPFEWISSAVDTINLTKSNLNEIYKLEWEKSNNQFGDVNYKVYASVGSLPYDEIHDTTTTNFPISYQDFYEGAFESFPTVLAATVKFSVVAIEGTDTIKVTGDDRVVYVNRYDYLSTAGHNIPEKFELHDNYPNPFNPTTTIRFDTPEVSNVNLTIYNMLGQKVRSFNIDGISPGSHSITWNATNDYGDTVGAGVYIYHLRANQYVKTKKMILLK